MISEVIEKTNQRVKRLMQKLPSELCYHNMKHTNGVVNAVKQIGHYSSIDARSLEILTVAALYHDIGFTVCYDNHEAESERIAEQELTNLNCDPDFIESVKSCIAATKLPQQPKNELEKIMCDADLFHLAQKDYWENNERLKKELCVCKNLRLSESEWYANNLKFLETHKYFTGYGKTFLENWKKAHIDENKTKLMKMCNQST